MSRQAFQGVTLTIVLSKIRQPFWFCCVTLGSVRILKSYLGFTLILCSEEFGLVLNYVMFSASFRKINKIKGEFGMLK